jgi:glycosyltransferase involved in cell wall biosynthesis
MFVTQILPRYPSLPTGGIENYVKSVSERLVTMGHRVEVIATDPSGRLLDSETINGVFVKRFRSIAPQDAYYLTGPNFSLYLKRCDSDILHIHSLHSLCSAQALLTLSNKEIVFSPHYHGPAHTAFRAALYEPWSRIIRRLLRKVSLFLCVSKTEACKLSADFMIDERKLAVIPAGLELDSLSSVRRRIDPNIFRLLFVGRLEEYKNPDKVLESAKLLSSRIGGRKIIVKMVGTGHMMKDLQRQAIRIGLKDNMRILCDLTRKQLMEEYSRANVFILPSLHEAYGIAAAEALATGVPTVVANAGALKEFVDAGEAIGVSPPITAEKLCEAILSAKSPPGAMRFLDWKDVAKRLVRKYVSVTENDGV